MSADAGRPAEHPVGAVAQIDDWPVDNAVAVAITSAGRSAHGDLSRSYRLASISKVIAAWAVLIAVEEGSVALEAPAGQPGCTVRHLLSHAGGYPFDGPGPIAPPGRRRIYSNTGIELAAAAVEAATGIAFERYLGEAVLEPLGMTATTLRGSPAHGIRATGGDVALFLAEMAAPTLLSADTARQLATVQFPDLDGIVPGIGRFSPCPWGLGVEIKGTKRHHWMGRTNSSATFGHFGGAGTFVWVDPVHAVALLALTDRPFDQWSIEALRAWPQLSDDVLAEVRAG